MVTTQLNTLADSLKDFLTDATQQIEKVVNNNIQSLACLLDDDYTSELTTTVSNAIQARLEEMIIPPTNKLTMMDHTSGDCPNQLTNIIKEDITLTITKHIDMQLALIHEKLTMLQRNANANANASAQITAPNITSAQATYASVAQNAVKADLADMVAKSIISDKQILICLDKTATSSPNTDLMELTLVTKANTTVKLMAETEEPKPTDVKFIAAKILHNGSVLYQLNSVQAASWLRNPTIQKAFLKTYSSSAYICNKLFHIIAEFTPTTFNAGSEHAHAILEANNSLNPGAVIWSKYIKPPQLQSPNQRSAHVLIGLSTKEDINKIIQDGLYIEGKHIPIQKTTADPKRCLKCQCYGHYASNCNATIDTCAYCAGNHCTNICPSSDNPPKCANCKGQQANGHTAADWDCPVFITERHRLHQCSLEHKYKFFPTNDPSTWKLLSAIEPTPPRYRPP